MLSCLEKSRQDLENLVLSSVAKFSRLVLNLDCDFPIIFRADGGAGAGDARPWERGARAQPETISHLDPFSVHGWVPSVPALWRKRKRPSRPGHYSRLPACCRLRSHRVADGAACHRRIRYGISYMSDHCDRALPTLPSPWLLPRISFSRLRHATIMGIITLTIYYCRYTLASLCISRFATFSLVASKPRLHTTNTHYTRQDFRSPKYTWLMIMQRCPCSSFRVPGSEHFQTTSLLAFFSYFFLVRVANEERKSPRVSCFAAGRAQ